MITVGKYFPEKHLKLLQSWWEARRNPLPNPDLMAPTGKVVSINGNPVCAGFLFKTDARIAVISHVVSSPEPLDREWRGKALECLISSLIALARSEGFLAISASSNLPRLNRRYENLGFAKTDEGEVHYGRAL